MPSEVTWIPFGLKSALENGNCVLFIGAGIGSHLSASDGKCAPSGGDLAKELSQHFQISTGEQPSLPRVAEVVELRKGRNELEAFVAARLEGLEPDDIFRWIPTRRWKAIFTTNYDTGVLRAYELTPSAPQTPVPIDTATSLTDYDPRFQVPVYYLHGYLDSTSTPRFLITERDYVRFRERRRMLFEQLKMHIAVNTILYVGYSNQDPNWQTVIEEVASEFATMPTPTAFRVAPVDDPLTAEILVARNITCIACQFSTFVSEAQLLLSESTPEPDRLVDLRSNIPHEFQDAFDLNPAPVVRLLDSWEYVNSAPFAGTPNVSQFLRGERPNWQLVGSGEYTQRDIEDLVYEDLLDYATSPTDHPRVDLILAPAGYGTTTLLMILGARVVRDSAGPVLMLKPGRHLREGDIEFACSILPSRPFFIVDDASRLAAAIQGVIIRLHELRLPAMLLLGSRLNEWQQVSRPPHATPYRIEPLSDPEIYRLIDYLERHRELDTLASLTRDQQFAVIKRKHEKQLLVALREATQGIDFDAIIEDEYRHLPGDPEPVQRAYLSICCCHQFGIPLRVEMLASVLGIQHSEVYKQLLPAAEGVILFEEIDQTMCIWGASARHRVIAQIVWERCATAGDREGITQSTLAKLNLGYKRDRDLFDYLYQADHLVDALGTLENKARFFDQACSKDPENPYVKQHYARMLLRSEQLQLALQMIDSAIAAKKEIRVLHHTRGQILMALMQQAPSPDVARRYLARAEDSYRRVIHFGPRDAYGYHGLAQLYIAWSNRVTDIDEASQYLSKAQEVVDIGLRSAATRDCLWVVSAEIEYKLGSLPNYIDILVKAVKENTNSTVARYLLAKAYLRQGSTVEAIETLEWTIQNYFEEVRSFILYANAQLLIGRPLADAIAVLRIALPQGYRDPRFIATLGGMLFMDKSFSEAEEVFSKRMNRAFSVQEMEEPFFYPRDTTAPQHQLSMVGEVVTVKAGFSFIRVHGFPDFFCPSSKYDGLVLQRGMHIRFIPAFTMKGAVALRPFLD